MIALSKACVSLIDAGVVGMQAQSILPLSMAKKKPWDCRGLDAFRQ
jgi:hypothetical protein